MKTLLASVIIVSMALGWWTAGVTAQEPVQFKDRTAMATALDQKKDLAVVLLEGYLTQAECDEFFERMTVESTDTGKVSQLTAARRALAAAGETAMVATVDARIEALTPVVEIEAIE